MKTKFFILVLGIILFLVSVQTTSASYFAVVDMVSNKLFILDSNGNYVNSVDFTGIGTLYFARESGVGGWLWILMEPFSTLSLHLK